MSRTPYKSFLNTTIMSVHGVHARWLNSVRVREVVGGRIVWEGDVETFELVQHPEAKYCYAWTIETTNGAAVLTALKLPPVVSPQTAIREAIHQGKLPKFT